MSHTLKILIADEHPVVAAGLRAALALDGIAFAQPATSPDEVRRLVADERPDGVILDILFDGDVRHSLVRDCRRMVPDSTIVVFTALTAHHHRRLALDAGADAFLEKSKSLDDLAAHFSELLTGRLALIGGRGLVNGNPANPTLASPARAPAAGSGPILVRQPLPAVLPSDSEIRLPHLTAREQEVAHLLSTGRPIAEIAEVLGVGAKTAAVHRDNLRKKMQCRDTNELIARLARIYAAAI